MIAFLTIQSRRAGADIMITPREIIRDYLTLLNILKDNTGATFENLMSNITFTKREDEDAPELSTQSAPVEQPKSKISLFDIDI